VLRHHLHLHVRNPMHLLTNIGPASGVSKGELAVVTACRNKGMPRHCSNSHPSASSALCTLTTQTGCSPALTLTSQSKSFPYRSAATSSLWLLPSLPPLIAFKEPTNMACSSTSVTLSSLTGRCMWTSSVSKIAPKSATLCRIRTSPPAESLG
jgi:hypothetical protein